MRCLLIYASICLCVRLCVCVWAKRGLRLGVCFVPTAMTTCTNFTSSDTWNQLLLLPLPTPPRKRQVSGEGVSAGFGSEREIAANENYCKRQLKKVDRLAKSSWFGDTHTHALTHTHTYTECGILWSTHTHTKPLTHQRFSLSPSLAASFFLVVKDDVSALLPVIVCVLTLSNAMAG